MRLGPAVWLGVKVGCLVHVISDYVGSLIMVSIHPPSRRSLSISLRSFIHMSRSFPCVCTVHWSIYVADAERPR